jgi:uncharacterized NAD(P)/FAD-binding protein YdhS
MAPAATTSRTEVYDVVFIGSGLSATYTTIRLLEELLVVPRALPVALATIERDEQFFAGIPYGNRSGTNALLITSMKDFIPSPERELFITWLNENRSWAFDEFRSKGGPLSQEWLRVNAEAIATGDWLDLYLPRYVFGLFLRHRVNDLLHRAAAAKVATHTTINAEVVNVARGGQGCYEVSISTGDSISAAKVVLAIGMPVPLSQFSELRDRELTAACLIDDPYLPRVQVTLERIAKALEQRREPADVVLIGANASTMEMIFRLNDDHRIASRVRSFVVLAPQGSLPERLVDPDPSIRFVPTNLRALATSTNLTAHGVFAAARQDVEAGTGQNLTISATLSPILSAMIELVNRLDTTEKLAFAGVWGTELGRYQRRAGTEYSDVVDTLLAHGRMQIVRGRFVGLGAETAEGVDIRCRPTGENPESERLLDAPVAIVINCSGAGSLAGAGAAGLVRNLVDGGLVAINPSGHGLVVDDLLQANDELFVVGPLMSGNVIANTAVWHMEHCGRIISYGGVLARTLASRL